jgi:hypothetical protein
MTSEWYRQIFPSRSTVPRQAIEELITTRQGYRLATTTGSVDRTLRRHHPDR